MSMKEKKLKIQMNGRTDEFYTPRIAILPLLPYLKKKHKIYYAVVDEIKNILK